MSSDAFEFRRRLSADVRYLYRRLSDDDRFIWQRADKALWVKWVDGIGWACVDATGQILSIPWGIPAADQPDHPPAGVWVSRKQDKSYVYDVVYV